VSHAVTAAILYAQNLFWLDDSCLGCGFMLITLTTDFGHRDPFVGIMKGVIARINPKAQVIDLTHGIPPQDVMAAALALRHSVAYFPRDSIHVVVVDPGVGGPRRPLLIESAGNYFIGPDNGVLSLAAAAAESVQVIELSNPDYRLKPTSATFHGRDIFAPAAAHLSLGVAPAAFGGELASFTRLRMPKVTQSQNRLEGEVVYVDGYGNLFTNIDEHDLTGLPLGKLVIGVGARVIRGLAPSYDSVKTNELAALVNSWGMLEIAAYKGNAQENCGVKVGDKVILSTDA
jgi:S-adenosyl-L-methionine hydrolase (adenosine-forming)